MLIQRSLGQELNQNVRRGPNISPGACQAIIAKSEYGASIKKLAAGFGWSESAIKYTIRTYSPTTTQKKPRSGCLHILSLHQKKIIYRKAHAAPKIEYSELAKVGTSVNADVTPLKPPSHSTLYRAIKRHGLSNFRCKVRPKLPAVHAQKQREFCKTYCNFPWGRRTLRFSDECSVQKGSGHNQEWCFRFPWEKWKKEMITDVGTSRKPAQMV
jgi:transposase